MPWVQQPPTSSETAEISRQDFRGCAVWGTDFLCSCCACSGLPWAREAGEIRESRPRCVSLCAVTEKEQSHDTPSARCCDQSASSSPHGPQVCAPPPDAGSPRVFPCPCPGSLPPGEPYVPLPPRPRGPGQHPPDPRGRPRPPAPASRLHRQLRDGGGRQGAAARREVGGGCRGARREL